MLYLIRERAKSWVLWSIVLLLIATFALWGINSYLGGQRPTAVLEVNGDKLNQLQVDQTLQQRRAEYRQALGDSYDDNMFEDELLRPLVEEQLISELLLSQTTQARGFTLNKQALAEMLSTYEAFQIDGIFDLDRYRQALNSQGYTPAAFEAQLHHSLTQQQLISGIRGSALQVATENSRTLALWQQQRSGLYSIVDGNSRTTNWQPTTEQISTYYDANPEQFQTEEQLSIAYLDLDSSQLQSNTPIDEATLQARYESELDSLRSPAEVRAAHILLKLAEDAEKTATDSTRTAANALTRRLDEGADFTTLAEAESEDRGSASSGGDLGWISPGMMDPDLETAIFALQTGEVSTPIRTRFGYHIVQVTERRGGEAPAYESLRDGLLAQAQQDAADDHFITQAELLQALSYEQPDSLESAATTLELTIHETAPFGRRGGIGITSNRDILTEAFSEAVLTEGRNSEPVELTAGRMVVLRLKQHYPSTLRALEEVREQIVTTLRNKQAATSARELGEQLLAQLQADPTQGTALAESAELDLLPFEKLTRTDIKEPGREMIQLIFRTSQPETGTPGVSGLMLQNNQFGLVLLNEVTTPSSDAEADEETLTRITASLQQQRGESDFSGYLSSLRKQAKIKRF